MAKQGKGIRTRQYNPTPTYAEYAAAVVGHKRGSRDAGGAVIHATPASKRREYASQIWATRKQRGNRGLVIPTMRLLRRNGIEAVAEMSERFHGTPATEEYEFITPIQVDIALADAGELVAIGITSIEGEPVDIGEFRGARLAMNATGNQMFIEGGDQGVDPADFGIDESILHEFEVLGQADSITYATIKHHLGDQGGDADYTHDFGEEGGFGPLVIYDTRNELLSFAGGTYTIPAEGIRN